MTTKKNNHEIKFNNKTFFCSVALCLELIGGKWKPLIVYFLLNGPQRSGELKRMVEGISDKVFTQTVRQLEKDGIVHREIYPVVPPKVEYSLTDFGQSFEPVLKSMCNWGSQFHTD